MRASQRSTLATLCIVVAASSLTWQRECQEPGEILAIVKEAPLGRHRIMPGLILRKALLHNTMLCNSEAWHNFNLSQVKAFGQIDEALIRGLVQGHSKIALPALYLGTGQIPLCFILACRRILYFHTILIRDPEELIYKAYHAQK